MSRTTGVLTERDRLPDAWIDLQGGPVIVTPASQGRNFRVYLTEDAQLEPPHTPHAGQTVTWRFEQDGTGGHTVSLNSEGFVIRGTLSPVADETANAVTFVRAQYDEVNAIWEVHGQPSVSALLDALGGTQEGSVLYRGANGWEVLDPGSAGQQLTSAGAGSPVTWDTA